MSPGNKHCIAALEWPRANPAQAALANSVTLPPKLAAKLLGLSAKTLANWRVQGAGPTFIKSPGLRGAVRYRLSALRAWQNAHERKSTSDQGGDRG